MYNHSSFSCRIVKFQLRLFNFVFVLQVNVSPLAVVSCDTLCLPFIQKKKNSELLRLINQTSQKGKRIARIYNYMKIRHTHTHAHTHTRTHTHPPKVVCGDRVLDQRYGNHLKYACYWVTLGRACTLHTNHSNFTLISRTTPFPKFGEIHTLVYEDQKNQPPGLVLHRRCRDRPVIQHVPN